MSLFVEMGCVPRGLVELWWFTSASHEYIGHSIPIRAISKLWQRRAAAAVESARRELRERQIVKKKFFGQIVKLFFGQIIKLFFLINCKTFYLPQAVVQWSSTRPFDILEKKNVVHKGPTWLWNGPNIDTLLHFINFKRIWCYPDQTIVYQTSAL